MAGSSSVESGSSSSGEIVEKAKADVKAEIDAAVTDDQKRALAEKLKQELKEAETSAQEVVDDMRTKGRNEHKDEGNRTLRTLTKVIEAAKSGIFPAGVESKPKAQKLIADLGEKGLTAETASAIEVKLKDYLTGDKDIDFSTSTSVEKTQFEKDFDSLAQTQHKAAEIVRDSIANKASDYGLASADDVKAKLAVHETTATDILNKPTDQITQDEFNSLSPDQQREVADRIKNESSPPKGQRPLDYDMQSFYGTRFKTDEEREFLEAIYDHDEFVRYVKKQFNPTKTEEIEKANKIKSDIREHIQTENTRRNKTVSETEINNAVDNLYRNEVSQQIRMRLVGMVDRIHVQLARDRASTSYDEIAKEDYMHGVYATTLALKRAIEGLSNEFEYEAKTKPDSDAAKFKLFVNTEDYPTVEDVDTDKKRSNGENANKVNIRIRQLATPKEVSLADFVKNLELEMLHFQHNRKYLHDGRSIYSHPAGEKGFYGGLGGYSELEQGADVDAMMALPDGGLAIEALQLYDKYLTEQFALQDWKNEPSQFTAKQGAFESHLEIEVLQALKRKHPDFDDERIKSALYMGVGMSRAVFLNEPENVAYADPVLTPTGGFTGTSYYTNDVSALMAFNPIHLYMRWQGEPNIYPFLFTPTSEKGGPIKQGVWDHNKMMEELGRFKDTYFKGRKELGDRQLLIDDLINMGGAAGIVQRKGWRQLFSNEANHMFKKNANGELTGVLDVTNTWKTLEKVGIDVMYDFISNGRIPNDVLAGKGKANAQDRQDLFNYLFSSYFAGEGDLPAYLNSIRGSVRDGVVKSIREGKTAPGSIDEAVEMEASNVFLYRTLARMVSQRVPTKFLRLGTERDRLDPDGKRTWERIRTQTSFSSADFDKIMKNIGLAESSLRSEVSDEIKTRLKIQKVSDLKYLDNLTDIRYSLTKDKLRELLKKQQEAGLKAKYADTLSDQDINNAVEVFEKIQKDYAGNKEYLNKFAGKLKSKFYPFTFAIDELDMSLMAFRGTGPRIIARSIKDIAKLEEALMTNCVLKLNTTLHDVAINGKKDFSPFIQMFKAVKEAYGDVHGYEAGYQVITKLAASVIAYYKKDTMSKGILGITRIGKKNSTAAEYAGRSSAVWEWDAVDIDNFVVALESNRLIPRDPYDMSQPPTYEPKWIKSPFSKNPIKLPEKFTLPFSIFGHKEIPLFRNRVKNYKTWTSDKLRKEYGGQWRHIAFDFAVKYGPFLMAFILWKLFKDALDEAQGKKKK